MTETRRNYDRHCQKRIVINLTIADYERWKSLADLRQMKLATLIRNCIESEITEAEDSYMLTVEDLQKHEEELKVNV